jgi:hypothetical protein
VSDSRVVRSEAPTRFTGLVLLAMATSLVLIAAACGGEAETQPAGQPTPTTTENGEALGEFTERFDSPLHGVSIGYPSGWRTRAATEPWGHGEVAFGAPDVDVIFHPTLREDFYFAVVSEPLGDADAHISGRAYVNALALQPWGICKGPGGSGGNATFQGHPAWFTDCDEPHGAGSHVVIVATATRGYIIYVRVPDERRLQATNGEWLEAALETVDLRPEDALDASNPSESP